MEYYGLVLVKLIIGFLIVITHLNISGKTQLSQMTPIDFIGNFVMGGIIGGVIYSEAIPTHQYVIVLIIGVSMISLLNSLSKRVHFFRKLSIGKPIPIIKKGRFVMESILEKKNKIDILNVSSKLHAMGIQSFKKIVHAQIEPDGQMTVSCEDEEVPSIIIMKEGKPREEELKEIGKDINWLNEEIKNTFIEPDQVFIAEYWNECVFFILNDGTQRTKTEIPRI